MTDWLEKSTIYLTKHGSHSYGLNTPTSDLDIKGICIPPIDYYFGAKKFAQAETKEPDSVIYEFKKFLHLVEQCNPNIIEVLWTDDSDVIKMTPLGEKFRSYRDIFVTKRVRSTFGGFAHGALHTIKKHRAYLIDKPKAPPTREEFGLPSYDKIEKNKLTQILSAIDSRIGKWNVGLDELSYAEKIRIQEKIKEALLEATEGNLLRSVCGLFNFSDDLYNLIEKEKAYRNKVRDYEQYQSHLRDRNPERLALEMKCSYDAKDATHLIRTLRVAKEALLTGKIKVKRDDVEELMKIRRGEVPIDELLEMADKERKELEAAYLVSTLPEYPDKEEVNRISVEILQEYFRSAFR